jgi:hypothetical protein
LVVHRHCHAELPSSQNCLLCNNLLHLLGKAGADPQRAESTMQTHQRNAGTLVQAANERCHVQCTYGSHTSSASTHLAAACASRAWLLSLLCQHLPPQQRCKRQVLVFIVLIHESLDGQVLIIL